MGSHEAPNLEVSVVAQARDREEVVSARLVVVGRMRFQSIWCCRPVGLTVRLHDARELDTGRRLNMVTLRRRMKGC
jgi:hypothetical protein